MSRLVKKSDSSTLAPSPKKGRESASRAKEARQEKAFYARKKFERWAESTAGLYEYQFVPLVAPPDDSEEGVFEAAEFALLPTSVLANYRHSFDEAREMLDHMEEQLEAALAAREAEEE